jgi:hypothetical protein
MVHGIDRVSITFQATGKRAGVLTVRHPRGSPRSVKVELEKVNISGWQRQSVQFTGGKAVPVTTVPVTKNEWVYAKGDMPDDVYLAFERADALRRLNRVTGAGAVRGGGFVPEGKSVPANTLGEAVRGKTYHMIGDSEEDDEDSWIPLKARREAAKAKYIERAKKHNVKGKASPQQDLDTIAMVAEYRGKKKMPPISHTKRTGDPTWKSPLLSRIEKAQTKIRRMSELKKLLESRIWQSEIALDARGNKKIKTDTALWETRNALVKKVAALDRGINKQTVKINQLKNAPVESTLPRATLSPHASTSDRKPVARADPKPDTRLPHVQLEESRKHADDDLLVMTDAELRNEYEKASVQSGGAFASAGVRRDAAGDELIRRGITQYKVPWSELPMKVHGSGQKDTKFDEVAHAKGVLAAKSLAGSGAVGPSPKHVKEAEKTLKKSGLMPSTYVIPDKHELSPVTRVYKTHKPVLGDIFLQGESRAEVIKIYKTARGNTAIDINVIGKKKGRIHTVYLEDAPEEIGVKPATLPKREYLTAKQIGERVDQLKSAPGVVDANERSRLKVLSNMVALNESKKKNSMPKSVKPSMNTVEPSAYRPAPKPKSAPTKTKTKPKSSKATNAAPMLTAYLKKIGVPGKVEAHKYPKGASAQFSYEVTLKKRDKKVESQIDKFYDKEKSTPRDGVLRFKVG